MSRQDLGDYLGLSLETVSRLFSRFQAEGLLSVQGRKVHLLDLPRLESVAEHCSQPIAARA
jgi:CRP/FNR family transcriptional regulator